MFVCVSVLLCVCVCVCVRACARMLNMCTAWDTPNRPLCVQRAAMFVYMRGRARDVENAYTLGHSSGNQS